MLAHLDQTARDLRAALALTRLAREAEPAGELGEEETA
jgi:hypothetical protein